LGLIDPAESEHSGAAKSDDEKEKQDHTRPTFEADSPKLPDELTSLQSVSPVRSKKGRVRRPKAKKSTAELVTALLETTMSGKKNDYVNL